MPRSTTVIPIRLPHADAAFIRDAAAASGRTVNRFLAEIVAAIAGSRPNNRLTGKR